MILEIFDKYTRKRIDLIRTFSYIEYTRYFNAVGSFIIKVPSTEKSIKNLQIGNYILFENSVCGVIEYRGKVDAEDNFITFRGSLIKKILSYRVFPEMTTYTGTKTEVARKMVRDLMISNSDSKRNISFISLATDEKYIPVSSECTKSIQGKELCESIDELLETDMLGCDLVPILAKYDEKGDQSTNIASFEFRVLQGEDRTIGNGAGNNPVVFSVELNNIKDFTYEEDSSDYRNISFVEGKDQQGSVMVITVYDDYSGIDRRECYIDAVDFNNYTLEDKSKPTFDQYLQMLQQKGEENIELYKLVNSFHASILEGKYLYERDYNVGDLVTIRDESLGIEINTQITAVTKSLIDTGEVVDFTFGYEKSSVRKILTRKGVL